MSEIPNDRSVLIVGGGPVGLTLAAMLSRFGVSTTVLEADDGYCTGSRAICLSRRSLEILSWAGAARHVTDVGLPWVGGRSYFRDREVLHFRMPSEPGERFGPMLNVQQYEVEEAAHRAIDPRHGTVRWGTRVTDVRAIDHAVEVDATDAAGASSTLRAGWVVACDGGRSTVRERLGLALAGVQYDGRYVIVDIEQASDRPVERLAWFDPPSNPGSTLLMHRQPGDVWRIDYQIRDDEDPVEAVRPGNVLPRVQSHLTMIGEHAPWRALWISLYNAKCLTLDRFRHGRVLFAGDAAHLVPIFGVRGLNSGLDDAANLAWKLARAIDAGSSDALLDSYSDERVHAARENIAYGAKSTEFMAPPHAGFRLMRDAALRLALETDGVRALINPRQTSPVAYPRSPSNRGDGPLVGEPAPDARLEGGRCAHLSELLDGLRFALVCFTAGGAGFVAPALDDLVVIRIVPAGTVADGAWVDRHGEATRRYGAEAGTTLLVRPDAYVAARWSTLDVARVRDALDAIVAPRVRADAA